MTGSTDPERILLVTGLSGAGKSTALRTLEDSGWEVVDNLPLSLLDHLLSRPIAKGSRRGRPLAIGIDSRTRDFNADHVVRQIRSLAEQHHNSVETLFLDCESSELLRRYSETRRRHPLAPDRPAIDGIAEERELMAPLRRWSEHIVDTTDLDAPALQHQLRTRFSGPEDSPTLTILSFGFSRGLPRNADIVMDVRFLRNPHWDDDLRPLTGVDQAVGAFIAADEAYDSAVDKIEDLLVTLLPRYRQEGKSYVTIAFGCTGGRHRSVHIAELIGQRLRNAGFSPTVEHRDVASRSREDMSGSDPTGE